MSKFAEPAGNECFVCLDNAVLNECNELIKPCLCNLLVHRDCLDNWRRSSSDPMALKYCSVCKRPYEYDYVTDRGAQICCLLKFIWYNMRDYSIIILFLVGMIVAAYYTGIAIMAKHISWTYYDSATVCLIIIFTGIYVGVGFAIYCLIELCIRLVLSKIPKFNNITLKPYFWYILNYREQKPILKSHTDVDELCMACDGCCDCHNHCLFYYIAFGPGNNAGVGVGGGGGGVNGGASGDCNCGCDGDGGIFVLALLIIVALIVAVFLTIFVTIMFAKISYYHTKNIYKKSFIGLYIIKDRRLDINNV